MNFKSLLLEKLCELAGVSVEESRCEIKVSHEHYYIDGFDPNIKFATTCFLFMAQVAPTNHNKTGMSVNFDTFTEDIWFCVFVSDQHLATEYLSKLEEL